ncbi:MAG: class II glutamine amidotransferase, partial [Myxococcales bacterium]
MCRLFGFRSPVPGMVHRSLVQESNCLGLQSREHPHGWGIGFYNGRDITLSRAAGAAFEDADFARISGLVNSDCVVAHVRKASVGNIGIQNSHPFRYEQFLFAHNGTLEDFDRLVREPMEALIAPDFRPLIRGETDSERCFFLFLTILRERVPLAEARLEQMAEALAQTVYEV